MPQRLGGNANPSGDDIAEGVHRLLKGIAARLGQSEREPTSLSPTTELAYLEAERIRKGVPASE